MTFVEFFTRDNTGQMLDISADATGIFGFVFQDRVSTPKGPGSVLGVSKTGDLYFQLDADTGCSFWGSCKNKSDFEAKGICLIPEDDLRRHRIKKVAIRDASRFIILQDTNGPCPLLAAVNALSLQGLAVDIPRGSDVLTQHDICDAIYTRLIATTEFVAPDLCLSIGGTCTLSGLIKADGISLRQHFTAQKVQALYQGLDVSPFFTNASAFEGERDASFFSALGLKLFHVWVLDESDIPSTLRDKSYNQVQDLAVSEGDTSVEARDFLRAHASQVTEMGILRLTEALAEGEVGVLFRNNHFSTVIKLNGDLLVLVSDEGYGDKGLIVFEVLSVKGDTSYRDGDGRVIEPIVLSALDAYGDQYSRQCILEASARLGEGATLEAVVRLISDSRGEMPSSLPEAPVDAGVLPQYYTQLVEMGFDPSRCMAVCNDSPESMEVAVALVLQSVVV